MADTEQTATVAPPLSTGALFFLTVATCAGLCALLLAATVAAMSLQSARDLSRRLRRLERRMAALGGAGGGDGDDDYYGSAMSRSGGAAHSSGGDDDGALLSRLFGSGCVLRNADAVTGGAAVFLVVKPLDREYTDATAGMNLVHRTAPVLESDGDTAATAPPLQFPLDARQAPFALAPSVVDNGTRWAYDARRGFLYVANATVPPPCEDGSDGGGPLRLWQDRFPMQPNFLVATRAPRRFASRFTLQAAPDSDGMRFRILFDVDASVTYGQSPQLALSLRRMLGGGYALWATAADGDDDALSWWTIDPCGRDGDDGDDDGADF